MRSDIAFEAGDGTPLRRGDYRPAATARERQALIVMAHGVSAVKAMHLGGRRRSLDLVLGFGPSSLIVLMSPTRLLTLVGLADHLTPADLVLVARERALEPKRLCDPAGWPSRRLRLRLSWCQRHRRRPVPGRPGVTRSGVARPWPIDYQSPSGLRSLRLEA